MYDRTFAIYCFAEDLLRAMRHAEAARREFSDAEVVTTMRSPAPGATTSASRAVGSQGEEFRGYSAGKRRCFYGVRVQVMVTVEGLPVGCRILPGGLSDVQGPAELPLSLPAGAEVAADAAYTFYEWEGHLLEQERVQSLVARKVGSKRRDAPAAHDYKQWLRRRVETVFSEIAKLLPAKIHATTLSGFVLKLGLFLFEYFFHAVDTLG